MLAAAAVVFRDDVQSFVFGFERRCLIGGGAGGTPFIIIAATICCRCCYGRDVSANAKLQLQSEIQLRAG